MSKTAAFWEDFQEELHQCVFSLPRPNVCICGLIESPCASKGQLNGHKWNDVVLLRQVLIMWNPLGITIPYPLFVRFFPLRFHQNVYLLIKSKMTMELNGTESLSYH